METIVIVEDILDRLGIRYENLFVSNVQTRNTIITDHKHVFVKMRSSDKEERDFAADVEFIKRNPGHGFQLLHPEVVKAFKRYNNNTFSIWKYQRFDVLNAGSLTPNEATVAARELFLIHTSEKYGQLQRNVDDISSSIMGKLNTVQFHALHSGLQHQIKQYIQKIVEPAIWLMLPPLYEPVVAHGNALPEKIVRKSGQYLTWSDFEKVRLTRKEYDYAVLKATLLISGANLPAWNALDEAYRDLHDGIDDYVVDSFVNMFLVERIIDFASQIMDTDGEDQLSEFLKEASPLLKGNQVDFYSFPHIRDSLYITR